MGEVARRLNSWVSLALAVTLGAGTTGLLWRSLSPQLRVQTDIVGYPIFASFDVNYLINSYLLLVILFPALTAGLYAALVRVLDLVAERRWAMEPRLPGAEEAALVPPRRALASAAGRLLAIAGTLALETVIVRGTQPSSVWRTGILAAVAVIATVVTAGLAWRRVRPGRTRLESVGAVNSIAAILAVAGLAPIASATIVTIAADGRVQHYSWLPAWLAVLVTVALLAMLLRCLLTEGGAAATAELERRAVLYVAVPIGLFLMLASITAATSTLEVFHEGERLVGGRLFADGYFPWRDLLSAHGVLEDYLSAGLGFVLFEPSRFGANAASSLLLVPLYFALLFALFIRWFGRNWALVAAAAAILINNQLVAPLPRFILLPLVLLLLTTAVAGRPRLGIALGVLLALQAILVPEAAYCLPACGIALIGADFQARRAGVPPLRIFGATAWTMLGGGVTLALFAVLLLVQGALSSFVLYYLVAAPGHAYTGGLPVAGYPVFTYLFAVIAPPVAMLAATAYLVGRLLRGRRLDAVDWSGAAAGIFALSYYPKFLDRADDSHAYQVLSASLPLLVFVCFRLVTLLEAALARTRPARWVMLEFTVRPVSIALLAGLLLFPGLHPNYLVTAAPGHFRTIATTEPELARLGPGGHFDPGTYADLETITSTYLGPDDWLFDFSNEPALYYFLLENRPRTRYYTVSFAIPEAAQADLVGQLKEKRPKLIVFTNTEMGLPAWDGISNMVRHYDVSQWILDNYVPLLSTHTQVFYAERSAHLDVAAVRAKPLSAGLVTDGLYFSGTACNWGDAPNYLRISPPARETPARSPVDVELSPPAATASADHAPLVVRPPAGAAWADHRWLEIEYLDAHAAGTWTLSDLASGDTLHEVRFNTLAGHGTTLRVYVGACSQWHGYGSASLYLRPAGDQQLVRLRLLP